MTERGGETANRDLLGRTLVVTGAAGDISKETAKRFRARGARVIGIDRRALSPEHVGTGLEAIYDFFYQADVSKEDGCKKVSELIAGIVTQHGKLDWVLHTVGAGADLDDVEFAFDDDGNVTKVLKDGKKVVVKPFLEVTDDDINTVMSQNFKSALFITQALLPLMKRQASSSFVYLSSIHGRGKLGYTPHYVASKAALTGYAKSLNENEDVAPIRSNVLVLGAVAGPNLGKNRYGPKEAKDTKLGRPIEPSEVADKIVEIAVNEAERGEHLLDGGSKNS